MTLLIGIMAHAQKSPTKNVPENLIPLYNALHEGKNINSITFTDKVAEKLGPKTINHVKLNHYYQDMGSSHNDTRYIDMDYVDVSHNIGEEVEYEFSFYMINSWIESFEI